MYTGVHVAEGVPRSPALRKMPMPSPVASVGSTSMAYAEGDAPMIALPTAYRDAPSQNAPALPAAASVHLKTKSG